VNDKAYWRSDIDALIFRMWDRGAACAVHRGAFRTLLGFDPTANDCLAYFEKFEWAFRSAAGIKIARNYVPGGMNIHLTSRDIARNLLELKPVKGGEK
jgi:hypothetical protein